MILAVTDAASENIIKKISGIDVLYHLPLISDISEFSIQEHVNNICNIPGLITENLIVNGNETLLSSKSNVFVCKTVFSSSRVSLSTRHFDFSRAARLIIANLDNVVVNESCSWKQIYLVTTIWCNQLMHVFFCCRSVFS